MHSSLQDLLEHSFGAASEHKSFADPGCYKDYVGSDNTRPCIEGCGSGDSAFSRKNGEEAVIDSRRIGWLRWG
jgi:hypothetical protein